jgi:hypothetical protein
MDYSGQSNSSSWNYTDPQKPNFKESIVGTVIEMQEVQSSNYYTKVPEFWPNGNPKLQAKIVFLEDTGGEVAWYISPKSSASIAVLNALTAFGITNPKLSDMIGKRIQVSTQSPPPGFAYGQGAPRPWTVQVVGEDTVTPVRGIKLFDQLAQQQPQQAPVPPQPQVQQTQVQVPVQQVAPVQQAQMQPQPIQQQPAHIPLQNSVQQPQQQVQAQVPVQQPQPQYVQQQIPQVVQPQATQPAVQQPFTTPVPTVQPQMTTPYTDDIPF